LRVKKDPMAPEIRDIERVETAIILDVSRPKQVRLMDVVEPQGLGEKEYATPLGVYGVFSLNPPF
jgi:hypothetical protein